jgi:hypothetical protein
VAAAPRGSFPSAMSADTEVDLAALQKRIEAALQRLARKG